MTKRRKSQRKLHNWHFAYMRALVQGFDAKASWERYLQVEGLSSDERRVKSTTDWIRAEFAAAAKREKRPGTARLVLLNTDNLAPDTTLPTIDEFAAASDWDDFSEEEKAIAYAEKFGDAIKAGGAQRRGRLIKRQLEALAWLERLVAEEPKPHHGVGAWFPPEQAQRMETAGVHTLQDLVDRINGVGARWWSGIRGIGELKGARIVEWLRSNELSIGTRIGVHVATPRTQLLPAQLKAVVPASTGLVPLEKFVVPSDLSGKFGVFRSTTPCHLEADNDYEAIEAWLYSKRDQPTTQRAYRKEAERLLLWSILERRKPVSSLTAEDADAFKEFLQHPPAAWCGPRHRQRWSPLWRPLEGPMAASAIRQTLTILRGLFTYLSSLNYVTGNPFSAVALPRVPARPLGSGRALSLEQWRQVSTELASAKTPAGRRSARAVRWLYATGLRIAELCNARCKDLARADFVTTDGTPVTGWFLQLVGKGNKHREVPVPDQLVAELCAFLERAGDGDPGAKANAAKPILANFEEGDLEPISPSGLYKAVKSVFERCADRLEASDKASAARLRAASPHWLRHSHGTHALNGRPGHAPVPVQIIQNNLGHESISTTSGYLTSEREVRLLAMQGFWEEEKRS